MQKLIIHRQFFTNSDCYKTGFKQTPTGIQVHSTGSNNSYLKRYVQPNDGLLGENKNNNSHNRSGVTVCANAYIGKLEDGTVAIYQTLPWNYRCWLSGSGNNGNANKQGYIGYEICEANLENKQYFEEAVMKISVLLDAYLCKKFAIPVSNIHDHSQLHSMGLASNHADIHHWLSKYGITMDDYRNAVQQTLQEGVQVTYMEGNKQWIDDYSGEQPIIPDIPIYQATVKAKTGRTVNMRQQPSKSSSILFKIQTGTAVDIFKEVNSEWSKIRYKETDGYMMSQFLVKKGQQSEENYYTELQQAKEKLQEVLNIIEKLLQK